MVKYAAFLRGINIGGKNIVKMSDLKKSLADKQFKDVKTYINSGNIVFRHEDNRKEIKDTISEIIQSQFNINIDMVIKTEKEVNNIIVNSPFNDKEDDNAKKVVVMLSGKIDEDAASQFRTDKKIVENYYHHDDLLYIYYHDGAGRSRFTANYIEKKLNVISTARNWNTIIKIGEMLKEI